MIRGKQEGENTEVGSENAKTPENSGLFLESHDWEMIPSEDGWDLVPNRENYGSVSGENPELSDIEQRVVPLLLAVVIGLLVITLFYFLTSVS